MGKRDTLTRILAWVGTVLAWFPILAPILLSAFVLAGSGIVRFDYLMPAELFLVALAGGGLLLWAAARARWRRGLFGWGLGVAIGSLVGGQARAVATGLASGRTEPSGIWWTLALGSIAVYSLALAVISIGGLTLLRALYAADGSSHGL